MIEALKALGENLDAPELEPDPERARWSDRDQRLRGLRAEAETLLECEPTVRAEVADAGDREELLANIAVTCGEVAAAHLVSGDRQVGLDLLRRAAALAPEGRPERELLLEASGHEDAFLQLVRARWLLRHGRCAGADAAYKNIVDGESGRGSAIAAAAQRELDTPRPFTGELPTFTRGAIGIGLYGSRDRREDGSVVRTACFSVLRIPLFALDAYRMRDAGEEEGWVVLDTVPLSRFARMARIGVILVFAAVVLVIVVRAFLRPDPP